MATSKKKVTKKTPARPALSPFSGPNYHKNTEKCGSAETPCAFCGRAVKNESSSFSVRVVDGGAGFGTAGQFAGTEAVGEAGDMGYWPVGSDCAKRLKAAGVYVHTEKA